MPDFNVGDRYRFVRDNLDGGGNFGRTGEVVLIAMPLNPLDVYDHGQEVQCVFENPDRQREVLDTFYVPTQCIELIDRVVQPEVQEIVRYVVVFQYPDEGGPNTQFFGRLDAAERVVGMIRQGNGVVLAAKKIKLQVPVIVFPELQVDEDDNIIEEDDGNAF